MKLYFKIIVIFLLLSTLCKAQNWNLELKSYVQFRTWSLTTKAVSKETQLLGATIKLFQGSKLVSQVNSNADGEFTLLVPPNGEFTGEVSYPGCNTKRFTVSTTGVPEKVGTNDYKPTFTLFGGFIMIKPYPGIDYAGLQNSLIKVSYLPGLKNFDDEEAAKTAGLGFVSKIYRDEDVLFENFCAKNRAGDAALKIPDCPLARKLYNEAISIIPNEEYPAEQLKKVGACLKEIEEAEKKAKEEAAAKEKARLDKLEQDKAEAARILKENEEKEKANAEKTAKSANDKLAAEKAAKEKAAAAKLEAEQAANKKRAEKKEEEILKGKQTGKKDEITGRKKVSAPDDEDMDAEGVYRHPVRKLIGVEQYKEYIVKANGYFKEKRYDEAKTAYEESLKHKPEDAFAIKRIAECEKILSTKK